MVSTYWYNIPVVASYLIIITLAMSTAMVLARFVQGLTRKESATLSLATCFALALAGLPAAAVAWNLRIYEPFFGDPGYREANWLLFGLYLGLTAILNVGLYVVCRRTTVATTDESN
jgi:hypothetical protein